MGLQKTYRAMIVHVANIDCNKFSTEIIIIMMMMIMTIIIIKMRRDKYKFILITKNLGHKFLLKNGVLKGNSHNYFKNLKNNRISTEKFARFKDSKLDPSCLQYLMMYRPLHIVETGAVFTIGRSRFADNIASHFFIRKDPVVIIECGDEHSAVVCRKY